MGRSGKQGSDGWQDGKTGQVGMGWVERENEKWVKPIRPTKKKDFRNDFQIKK